MYASGGRVKAVVVNAGCANAVTGREGTEAAKRVRTRAAELLDCRENEIFLASTGVIGVVLPDRKVTQFLPAAVNRLSSGGADALSHAILTTDVGPKVAQATFTLGGKRGRLVGVAKGAGMIHPNMATMLAFVMTDANVAPSALQRALKTAVDQSFNCISVEGHMSTNDTVLLLASGKAGISHAADYRALTDDELKDFQAALIELCIELAVQIPNDGEGASHLITIHVRGAKTRDDARRIAQTVANSALVKTAIAGGDPNWGRIVSAAGYAGVPFDPAGVDLAVNGHKLYEHGAPVRFDAKAVSAAIKASRETTIELTLREGTAAIRFWTSDLNVEYVRFNADYTT